MKYLKTFEGKEYNRIELMFKEHLIDLIDQNFTISASRNFLRIRKYNGAYKFKWGDVKDSVLTFMYAFKDEFQITDVKIHYESKHKHTALTFDNLEDFKSSKYLFSVDIHMLISNEYIDIDYDDIRRKKEEWARIRGFID